MISQKFPHSYKHAQSPREKNVNVKSILVVFFPLIKLNSASEVTLRPCLKCLLEAEGDLIPTRRSPQSTQAYDEFTTNITCAIIKVHTKQSMADERQMIYME